MLRVTLKKLKLMSRTIHHIKSETSFVKGTLEVYCSDLFPCSCHEQAMKALAWQRKHLNEVVHIFHCSVWKRCRFKVSSSQHRLLRLHSQSVKHFTLRGWLLSPWPSSSQTTNTSGPSWPVDASVSFLLFTSYWTDGWSQVSAHGSDVWLPLLFSIRKSVDDSEPFLPLHTSSIFSLQKMRWFFPFTISSSKIQAFTKDFTGISPENQRQPQRNHASLHN